ncbi:FAD-dependent oxidoreductase [Proteiniclasticum sp. SCR006]|uniref:FAD-dependent oxidoreductase n=1 Tax=Proteiniclasticum aestuarii TaxID=2817862 RepID=A0A939HDT3_9CLOT|nr:FAD-dependent oxidoreductase [Proteiniclasticum aestuarii]MBO1265715.1 FAD-dependent oxidoreductase [Proteiniclasticum aestuarii]
MKVVIIGAVAAGLSAAYSIKKNVSGAEITVLEKGEDISYGACGFPYYIEGLIEEEKKLIARDKKRVLADGIDLRLFSEAIDVDFQNKSVKVRNLSNKNEYELKYDKLVIAVGARSNHLDIFTGMKGVFPLNTLKHANAIKEYMEKRAPERAIILGGGNKGLELLETMTLRAVDTQVIEYMPDVMNIYDPELSELLLKELRGEGHKINTSEKALDAVADEKGFISKVITDKGEYSTDMVIETIGLKPNTEFLEGKGLKMERGAILTDLYGRTNIEDVYAGGDCAMIYNHIEEKHNYLPLGTNANKTGKLIGLAMAGKEPPFKGVQASSMMKTFEFEMAMTGVTDQRAKFLGLDYDSVLVRTRNKSGYYPGGTELYIKLTYLKKNGKIIGAQIFGREGSALRIQGLVTAVYAGLDLYDLAYMDFGYIPPLNSVWDSINVAARKALSKYEREKE